MNCFRMIGGVRWVPFVVVMLLPFSVAAHPVPDVPVRGDFKSDGMTTIQVEVDPRCFAEDPENTLHLKKRGLERKSKEEQKALFSEAERLIATTLRFHFEPADAAKPEFEYRFQEKPDAVPDAEGGIPVMILAEWTTNGLKSYQLEALKPGRFSVYFLNKIDGKKQKLNVLFPGEKSYCLDVSKAVSNVGGDDGQTEASASKGSTFLTFLRLGFVHVVPRGLDHILFVLGLFLLSRQWRPLLLQVTTFTLAHTLSLALSTLGLVRVSPSIVEPVIALSIVVIAIENIFRTEYSNWRLAVVFVFGLIHGLGFAGVLSEILGNSDLVVGLLGFNAGVEVGQLAVIAAALLVTFYLSEQYHRRIVAVPGSIAIALVGLFWTFERIQSFSTPAA